MSIGKLMSVFFATILFGTMLSHGEMRIWTSIKGDTVEAEFVKFFGGKVVLRKPDGKELKVSANGLCAADRKYLNESIPPTIEIDVDIDNDRKEVGSYSSDYSSYGWAKKTEKVKCEVTVTKKSRDENSTPLIARLYVFSKNLETDELRVEIKQEQEFSFEHQKNMTFASNPVLLKYEKSSTYGDRGETYEGYLVFVENETGQLIDVHGSRKKFEENFSKITPAVQGTRFDDDLDMLNPPSNNSRKKKSRN